jgi:triosephosphate isomerase
MEKKKIIIGNWKMNPSSSKEAEKLFSGVAKGFSGVKKTEIVFCPPFIYLESLYRLLKAKRYTLKASLGVQNVSLGDVGPYTGEVSAGMLYGVGAKYAILGHSERRAQGESNGDINKKIKFSLVAGLRPILCVGESVRDEQHGYFNLIKKQVEECLSGISKNSIYKIIIAYEPIWAISSTPDRRDATPDDCREMVIFIRKVLSDKFGKEASRARIIYGGSVNSKNAKDFLQNGGIDGLLVGNASLDVKKFTEIIKICETLNK